MDATNIDLGLTEPGRKKSEVERDIKDAFESLTNLIDHLGILDMASAFEGLFRARLSNAIGEARKAVGAKAKIRQLYNRDRLIREIDDFQGLANIIRLISGHLSPEVTGILTQIRDDRNKFTHGTDIGLPPRTTIDQARETLNEIIKGM